MFCSHSFLFFFFFFFNDTATTEIYTLSLHDALPICVPGGTVRDRTVPGRGRRKGLPVYAVWGPAQANPGKPGFRPHSAVLRAGSMPPAAPHLEETAFAVAQALHAGLGGGARSLHPAGDADRKTP